ncbi:MAG TPA: type II toxin-antitoxin system VapC family toxin [Humisphaera sp.]
MLDSNIVIYSASDPRSVADFILAHRPVVSSITRVEVLGFHKLDPADKLSFERFFAAATVVPASDEVIDQAIALRQVRKMSLGDSLVAATALAYGLALATRNVSDFRWIANLRVIDPFAKGAPT